MPSTAARSAASFHDSEPTAEVLAAGVLPWRATGKGLEVLLIHRPDYDDWSWPKGKLDDGETLPECAVREVREEVGLDVELGLPLPSTRYTVNGGKDGKGSKGSKDQGATKEVWYWAVEASRQTAAADGKEVDRLEWVSAEQAREQLTNATDVEPLKALIAAHRDRTLRTVPFIVLRHAKAKPRASWSRAEGARPLAPTGQRQALAVGRLLGAWDPRKIVTSPWRRCVETVTPFVKDTGRGLKENGAFTEKAVKSKPKRTRKEIHALLAKVRSTVLCTHRPVLPVVLEALSGTVERESRDAVLATLPRKDPYLKPGGLIVAQQAVDSGGRIVSLEVYDVWDD